MAATTLWPWEKLLHLWDSAFYLGWKNREYLNGCSCSEFHGSCLLTSAEQVHLALGLSAGVAGARSDLGASQALQPLLPWVRPMDCRPRPAPAHVNGTIPRASLWRPSRTQKGLRRPKAEWGPLPSEARSSPGLFTHQRAGQAVSTATKAQHGRPSGQFCATLLPDQANQETWGAWALELRAGIPGAGSSGKRDRGWGSASWGAWGLGAPGGWEDGTQSHSWTRDVPKMREGSSSQKARLKDGVKWCGILVI